VTGQIDVFAPGLADLLECIEVATGADALRDPVFALRTDTPCSGCQHDAQTPVPTVLVSFEGEEPRRLCLACITSEARQHLEHALVDLAAAPAGLEGYVEWRLGRGRVHAVIAGDTLTLCAVPAPGERYRIRSLQLAPACDQCVAITTDLAEQLAVLKAGRHV